MATQVLIAHTGQRLEVETAQFALLDDLKAWAARHSGISPQNIIALTPQGRSVKLASLHAEREIYIYDKRVSTPSSGSAPSSTSRIPLPRRYTPPNAPNSIDDVQEISSWQGLYKDRRSWAMQVAEDCGQMDATARARYDEIDVIIKCLDAAVANLENSIKSIEPRYKELKEWADPAIKEHEQLSTSLERNLHVARSTPISAAMVKFMTRGQVTKQDCSLIDLIELDTAKKAGNLALTAHRRFSDKSAELDKAAKDMYRGIEGLMADFDQLLNRSALSHSTDSSQLQEDIEAVVNQVDSDYRTALGYGRTQRDLAQASKTASNHTERLVPTLKKRAKEMDDFVQYATEARNAIATESARFMQTITDVTFAQTSVKGLINAVNTAEADMTTFDYLRLIHQLPYMYASYLVEGIRRREWTEKVKTDSSTLANEMALFQDEEAKRRRKWHKTVGSTYGPNLEPSVMGLEVNLLGDDNDWPPVTKEDIEKFSSNLRRENTDESIIEDIAKLMQELTNPTKQQSKRLKAFKNGSIHEASLGRSGLMMRGDDDLLRSLQDDKSRVENKLKTAESRVRRLEDLLHRQSQASRPSNLFQPAAIHSRDRTGSSSSVRSNRVDDSRRGSDGADPLLRKIAQLENELREERQRSSKFEQDLSTRTTQHTSMKDQIDEVNSTKKDLLENLEALKRESLDERKSLEDEIKTLRARLEDTEDEIENFGESRENEKATYVERVHTIEAEMEQLTKRHKDEMLKAQGQIDFLRKETRMQRERLDVSDRDVQTAQDETRTFSKKLQETEESSQSHIEALKKLFVELLPGATVPQDVLDLIEALSSRAIDLTTKVQNAESDTSLLKTDLEQAQSSVKESRAEVANVSEKLAHEEGLNRKMRESLSTEKAKMSALEGEVAEGRDQLNQLRAQLSDGETGSETLQKKLQEEEEKTTKLAEELASRQSQVGSLEEELRMLQEKLENLQSKLAAMTTQYETRDGRTKDLTQRLYSQNDRLARLLDRLGYAVVRQDGEMTINKIPRSERTTQNPNDSSDPGSSIRKSITLGGRSMHESADLELLYWMNSSEASVEAEKFEAFMKSLGYFDMDTFAETMYLRIKEAEHKARKWQREARSYRDRAHTLQRDSHDKIAFKHFKEGDLALFLPTRNNQVGAWAAFNVGFPHYFLHEQDAHRLRQREWLVARISRIEEKVVDLSKSLQPGNETDSLNEEDNDNPFQLSDGLTWYMIEAHEDKAGAPSTPGMGKSTVASTNIEATAKIHAHAAKGKGRSRDSVMSIEGINKTLSKSLESRRSSSTSKKALPFAGTGTALLKNSAIGSETNSLRAAAADSPSGTSPRQGSLLSGSGVAPATAAEQGGDGIEASKQKGNQGHASAADASEPRSRLQREETVDSTGKKSVVWDSLWSVDYSYESPPKKKS